MSFWHLTDDWKGPYIQDPESLKKQYLSSASAQNRAWNKQALGAVVRGARHGLPAFLSHVVNKAGFRTSWKRVGGKDINPKDAKISKRNPKRPFKKGGVSKEMARKTFKKRRATKKRVRRSYKKASRKHYKRRRISRGGLQRRLLSAMAAPKQLVQTFSSVVEDSTGNDQIFSVFDITHTKWAYEQLSDSQDNSNNAFISGGLDSTKNWVTKWVSVYQLKNNCNYPIKVKCWKYQMKRDYTDTDYTQNFTKGSRVGQLAATNAVAQAIFQGMRAKHPTADDAPVVFLQGDTANFRTPSGICCHDGATVSSMLLSNIAKVTKVYKTRVIEPGKGISVKMVDNRHLKIDSHYHLSAGGNHNPMTYGGRSEFLVFRFQGTIVGTNEAEGGVAADQKIGIGSFQVACEWKNYITMKSISPQVFAQDFDDYRPVVAEANQEAIADVDNDPIVFQEV